MWLTLSFLAFDLLLAPRAALGSRIELDWLAPERCPDQARVVAELESSAEHARSAAPPLFARARITREGASFVAELTTSSNGVVGQRSLRARDCVELTRAIVIVLQMSLSQRAEQAEAPPTRAAPAERVVVPAQTANVHELHPAVSLQIGAALGVLPDAAAYAELGFELRRSRWSLLFTLDAVAPQRETLPAVAGEDAQAKASFVSTQLGLAACWHDGPAGAVGLTLAGCGGVSVGLLRGSSSGVSAPGSGVGFYPSAFLAGIASWPIIPGALELRASVLGARAIAGPGFGVHERGVVFSPSPYSLRLGLGGAVWF